MSDGDLVLRSRRVVTPDGVTAADVVVRAGKIAAVAPHGSGQSTNLHEVGDAAVLPGAVDAHVHCNEPGRTSWEGFATATRAAAAGGITTLVDMPLNSLPPTTSVEALEAKRAAAASQAHVDVAFWGGVVHTGGSDLSDRQDLSNRQDLGELHAAGVVGFKAFLCDSGVPEFPPLEPSELREVMARLAVLDALLVVHAEDPRRLAPAASNADPYRYATWLATRPPEAEEAAVDAVVADAAATGCRVHVLHVSAAGAAERIGRARTHGVRVTGETCPHYLALQAADVADGDTSYKCAPPIRDRDNQERLWAALARGALDLVASDHSPCPPELKYPTPGDVPPGYSPTGGSPTGAFPSGGDFLAAWGGIASLQLSLPVVWSAARGRGHGLEDVARWMAERPAALTGLPAKGRITAGCDADLVVFDPDAQFVVRPASLEHRHPVTPYAGATLDGRVRTVWSRGRRIVHGGAVEGAPRGRLLRRAPDGDLVPGRGERPARSSGEAGR